MDNGWIQLHRKILDWEWYQKPEVLSVFLYLVLSANHQDGRWQGIEVKRGQLITGRLKIAEKTKLSEQIIRTCLKRLKSTNEITIKSTNRFSLITIVKYEDYQRDDRKPTSKLTKTLTNNQPTTNQQLTTNNNDNNVNNDNNMSKDIQAKPVYGTEEINNLIKEFETVRGFKSAGGAKDRIMAKHLLDNYTPEQLTYMLKFCDKPFAPRIGSVCDLWFQRGKILAGIKDLKNKKGITIIG